jgi:uncharacterized membrane protein YeiH
MRGGPDWFIYIETLGILSFAINAMIVAKGKGLSSLGVFICAFATALGGGTLRDVLLGPAAQPFFWMAFPFYLVAIFVVSMAYAHADMFRRAISKRDVLIKESAEAIALASLGVLGAAKAYTLISPAMQAGALGAAHLWIVCAFLGAVGAAFGSILRDVMINEFPGALRPGVWVLEALFIGCGLVAALRMADVPQPWAILFGFLVILVIRLRVVFFKRAA